VGVKRRSWGIAAVIAVLALLTGCGGEGGDSAGGPMGRAESATLAGVRSGELELTMGLSASGGESLRSRILGTFLNRQGEAHPQVDMAVEAQGSVGGTKVDLDGGVTLLSDRLIVNYEGQTYEPDPEAFGAISAELEESEGGLGGACWEAAQEIPMEQLLKHVGNEGEGTELDGTPVTRVSGEIDPAGAAGAFADVVGDPACGEALAAVGLPTPRRQELAGLPPSAIRKGRVEIAVDENDVLRDLNLEMTLAPDGHPVMVELELRLAHLNEVRSLPNPSPAQPLENLFERLGLEPYEGRLPRISAILSSITRSPIS
jgi:hypothetical protein